MEYKTTPIIEFASTEKVDLLAPFVKKVLVALGHPKAWVSDQSSISDFCRCAVDSASCTCAAAVAECLGVEVNPDDRLVAVAQRLKDASRPESE